MIETQRILTQPIRYLKGVGPQRSQIFQRLGIETVGDLLFYFPRRYEDRSSFKPIPDLQLGETVSLKGEVLTKGVRRGRRINWFELVLGNDTGMIHAVWFNQPYLDRLFQKGDTVILSGKVEFYKKLQLTSPEFEVITDEKDTPIHTGRIVPIYPLTEHLSQKMLRSLQYRLIEKHVGEIGEYLPDDLLSHLGLLGLKQALSWIHFPPTFEQTGLARKRLIFDDFFIFELLLAKRVQETTTFRSRFSIDDGKVSMKRFCEALPFTLTASQQKVMEAIASDLVRSYPMTRLLQGDVGSGKTVIATFFLWAAVEKHFQAAFLVPTEILAEQHLRTLQELLKPFRTPVWLLTGGTSSNERQKILSVFKSGEKGILIGTHALLQEEVLLPKLGALVIDEQHKFGVRQRAKLLETKDRPHLLVMTATPIPRTLGLTLYGDLDVSLLTEFPQGTKQIKTWWFTKKRGKEVFQFIRERLDLEEQAFVIFPAVKETEKLDLEAATHMYEQFRKMDFRSFSVGLVHGRMKKEDKERVMQSFRKGQIQLLVATSVVEVGIDAPEASVIVIENAERFGLSQLHQLRGRVGRRGKEAFCFLIGDPQTEEGKRRLRVLTKTTNGFVIAEEDLKLRGPGDFLGVRQSGLPLFYLGDIVQDQEQLRFAREQAFQFLKSGRDLDWATHPCLQKRVTQYGAFVH